MSKPDPTLLQIAAQFTQHGVEKSGGGYLILDRRTSNPVARLRPIPDTDRFELLYWSNIKGRWTTFGNMGRMKLMVNTPPPKGGGFESRLEAGLIDPSGR